MKTIRKRFKFLLVATLLLSVFAFAPGAFAETQQSASITAEDSETPQIFTISVKAAEGGTITTDKTEAAAGDTVTYTITPNKGYKIKEFQIGDDVQTAKNPSSVTTGTFQVTGNVEISAIFEKVVEYKINTKASKGGTITKSVNVAVNSTITVFAKPKSGYYLTDLQVDGKSLGVKTSYTFKKINKDHTVKAVFKKQVKIMLDAGHYGSHYNHSPVYKPYYESNMTWQLHLYLKAELQKYNGFYVGTTRTSKAQPLEVYYRGKASKGYDLFLSLHSNYSSNFSSDAPLIIHQKKNGASKALIDDLGKVIQSTMGTRQRYTSWYRTNSDKKTEYYGVLRGAARVKTKGLILEHSFHSNRKMTKWLYRNSNLKKLAKAEAKVLANHYNLKLK